MSHFATYECNVSNLEFVKAALKDMGLHYKENVTIKDWAGQRQEVVLAVVDKSGRLLPLGWKENEKELELIADWFETPFSEKQFTNQVSQLHSKYQVLRTCEENRWDVDMNNITMNENGEIEILATQFV